MKNKYMVGDELKSRNLWNNEIYTIIKVTKTFYEAVDSLNRHWQFNKLNFDTELNMIRIKRSIIKIFKKL